MIISARELSDLLGTPMLGEVGGLSVTSQEIDRLDAKIKNLDTDIRNHPQPPFMNPPRVPGDLPSGNPAFAAWKGYELEWNAFALEWSRWYADHQTVLSQTGDAAVTAFTTYQARYNELLRRFLADFKGATQAKPSNESGPLEGLAGSIGSVLGTLALLGTLGVAGYFGFQFLVARAASRAIQPSAPEGQT